MKGNESTPLRWVVLRIDTTPHWNFDVRAPNEHRPDRVYTVWCTSFDLGVHICSATPSAEMWFVESYPEWDDRDGVSDADREAWQEWVMASPEEEVVYMNLPDLRQSFPDLAAYEKDENWHGTPRTGKGWAFVGEHPENERDNILEYVRCNSQI